MTETSDESGSERKRRQSERVPAGADAEVVEDRDAEDDPIDEGAAAAPTDEELRSIVESLVFVADQPVATKKLARQAHTRMAEVKRALDALVEEYRGRGIELVEVGNGWQFRSSAKNASYVRAFIAQRPVRLTRAQLESLAIVAYRQPVTRPEMEEIRGVDCGSALRRCSIGTCCRSSVKQGGAGAPAALRHDRVLPRVLRPRGLTDLPTLREFSELSDESRALFERKLGEPFDCRDLDARAAASASELDADEAGLDDDDEREDDRGHRGAEPRGGNVPRSDGRRTTPTTTSSTDDGRRRRGRRRRRRQPRRRRRRGRRRRGRRRRRRRRRGRGRVA